jgi:AraC-like DNA-binding protein
MQNIPSQSDMQGDLLKILFQMLQEYRISNESKEESLVPREELFSRFYKAIEEHFRESHEVQYYADLFGLTPKHFAAIIKKQTGIKALTWINNYVMIQSKSMLRHMQQMPIQQVALQMGFTELSAFSRFFKTNEGVTPSEYREKIK